MGGKTRPETPSGVVCLGLDPSELGRPLVRLDSRTDGTRQRTKTRTEAQTLSMDVSQPFVVRLPVCDHVGRSRQTLPTCHRNEVYISSRCLLSLKARTEEGE